MQVTVVIITISVLFKNLIGKKWGWNSIRRIPARQPVPGFYKTPSTTVTASPLSPPSSLCLVYTPHTDTLTPQIVFVFVFVFNSLLFAL